MVTNHSVVTSLYATRVTYVMINRHTMTGVTFPDRPHCIGASATGDSLPDERRSNLPARIEYTGTRMWANGMPEEEALQCL